MELHAGGLTAVAFLLWGWLGALFSLGVFVIVSIGVALGRRAHRRSQAGFTLVEAVISVGLVTLVLIPVIRLFLIGFAVHSSANTRMVMVNLIREKLDGVQASVVNGHLPADQDWHCVNPDGTADLQWKRTIEPWGKEGWEKADDPGRLYKVTVEVRKNPCEKAIDPTKPPPPADEGWAVVRFG